ncbi:hypothetical protein [Methylobacterium sp. E-046]|uniref:hypothetical protein n=1 Tax=Methylobacterium sp. E-046 TaxID=2836576 RepID=UPI001FB9570F|nr:hypothetical protein [Methylobacterium sp. E-046]MCJ2102424.1 hypothetical protein [Methylobacterium sp. E-046]
MIAATADEVRGSLLLLFGGSREYGASKDEMRMKAAIYGETIAKAALPIWALEKARDAFGNPGWRSLWDGKGVPGRADIVAECRFILLPTETELARIERILEAELYDTGATDDDRANAVAHWETVKADMRGESVITEQTEEEISAERTSMALANERFRERARREAEAQGRGQAMWGRIPISDELARQIGLRVPVPDDEEAGVH